MTSKAQARHFLSFIENAPIMLNVLAKQAKAAGLPKTARLIGNAKASIFAEVEEIGAKLAKKGPKK